MQADLRRRLLRGCHEALQAGIVGGDVRLHRIELIRLHLPKE